MPHTPDPYVAFLSSLQDAYAAGVGPANAFVPGAQGVPGAAPGVGGDPSGVVGGTVGGIGAGGASVPGTATTGSSLLESIFSGQIPVDSPAATSLASLAFGGEREPSERGDLGADVTGGDLEMLAAVLQFGPLAPALLLGQLVFDDSTPGFGAAGADLSGATPIGPADPFGAALGTSPLGGLSFGGSGDSTPGVSGGGPGAGPNRGAERAGNRGR